MKGIVYFIGQHGLYNILELKQNVLFVEELSPERKRSIKQMEHTRVVALDDISVFTTDGSLALWDFFIAAVGFLKTEPIGKEILLNKAKLFELYGQIMPNYDSEKVQQHEIKKIFSWYNILQKVEYFNNLDEFKQSLKEETAV